MTLLDDDFDTMSDSIALLSGASLRIVADKCFDPSSIPADNKELQSWLLGKAADLHLAENKSGMQALFEALQSRVREELVKVWPGQGNKKDAAL